MRACLLLLVGCSGAPAQPDPTPETGVYVDETGSDTDCVPSTWYRDADGDGYGDEANAREACDALSGEVAEGGDCDDTTDTVHPGADEICGDGVDNDCTPTENPCRPENVTERDAWMSRVDGSWTKATDAGLALALGPSGLAVGAPSDSRAITDGGAVAIFPSPGTELSNPIVLYSSDNGSASGQSLAWTDDVTGDGTPDLLVGSPSRRAGERPNAGALRIVSGPVREDGNLTSELGLFGSSRKDYAGRSVAAPGDVTSDGRADILVGMPQNDGERPGVVVLVAGPVSGDLLLEDEDDVYTSRESVRVGESVQVVGDLDGNGETEIVIGGVDATLGVTRLHVVPARPTGRERLEDSATATLESVGIPNSSAIAAGPGDVDGDGYDDLWVGAPYDGGGRACFFPGPVAGPLALDDAAACLRHDDEQVGASVAGTGDIDGDGTPDLAATTDAGAVLLIYGVPEGAVESDAELAGETAFGSTLAAGDADEDGLGDLAVGLQKSFGSQGVVWLRLGSSL